MKRRFSAISWPEVGVPAGAHFRALLYSVPTESLVLHAKVDHRLGLSRLYGRALAAGTYQQLVSAEADESQEWPLVCVASPSVYYLTMVKEATSGQAEGAGDNGSRCGREEIGGRIKGVFRKDLITGVVTPIVEYPPRAEKDRWITSLHGVSPDGGTLFCTAADLDPGSTGEEKRYSHFLFSLDLATGALAKLSLLRAVFF